MNKSLIYLCVIVYTISLYLSYQFGINQFKETHDYSATPVGWKVIDNDSSKIVRYDFTQKDIVITIEDNHYKTPTQLDSVPKQNSNRFYFDSLGRRHVTIIANIDSLKFLKQ